MARVTRRDSLLAVLVAVIWGGNFVAIDVGLDDVPPFLFLAIRFVLVAFPLVFFVARPQAPWQVVVAVGFFMSFGQFGLLYLAMATRHARRTGLARPAGAGHLHDPDRRGGARGAGRPAGRPSEPRSAPRAWSIVAWGFHQDAPLIPLLVMLGAALSWAIGNVVVRAARCRRASRSWCGRRSSCRCPPWPLSLLVDGPAEISGALGRLRRGGRASTLYTAVLSSLLGYTIFNCLMASYPAASVVPFILLVPPVGIAVGVGRAGRGAEHAGVGGRHRDDGGRGGRHGPVQGASSASRAIDASSRAIASALMRAQCGVELSSPNVAWTAARAGARSRSGRSSRSVSTQMSM